MSTFALMDHFAPSDFTCACTRPLGEPHPLQATGSSHPSRQIRGANGEPVSIRTASLRPACGFYRRAAAAALK